MLLILAQSAARVAAQAPTWDGYAENPQHTALSTTASQPLGRINWQTPVDLDPQYGGYGGDELLIHYGSPLITAANTVIVPVKTGATGGFEINAVNGSNGSPLWTQTTDYILSPHNWTPSYSPVLTPTNRMYYAGAGGTVYYRDNVNTPGAVTPTQEAFYGNLSTYTNSATAFNNSVYIDTPITSDAQGDIFFGYQTNGSSPLSALGNGGIARISASGVGTYMPASTAAGDLSMNKVVQNCAPALSPDGSTLYVAVNAYNQSSGYLLALNSTTLATESKVVPMDPKSNSPALLPDDGTASPTVGPDGDVYFGVLDTAGTSRGWMLHYSGNLSQTKTPGGFGWDDTASIIPASMVPSYHGTSTYLLMTKYNNYKEPQTGGGGQNMIAILDPNTGVIDDSRNNPTGVTIMDPVLTILGPTPDTGPAGAVREWCINDAVVDPATDSVLVNSEDGYLYRWDLATNTFTQKIQLSSGIGEAYTPTLLGPDGTIYAINDAILFAVVPEPSTLVLAACGGVSLLAFAVRRAKSTQRRPR